MSVKSKSDARSAHEDADAEVEALSDQELVEEVIDMMVQYGWSRRALLDISSAEELRCWKREAYGDEEIMSIICQRRLMEYDGADLRAALMQVGLSRSVAHKYYTIIGKLQGTCYTTSQLIDVVIEYALGKYDPIRSVGARFYYDDRPVNVAFTTNGPMGPITNVNVSAITDGAKALAPIKNKRRRLFFHCTNYAGALNIATRGPVSSKGRKCLDFGITPSFYLTPDIQVASEWGQKKSALWHDEVALVVFEMDVPSNYEDAKIFKVPDLEWSTLVSSSRQCIEDENDLDGFKFIFGPMLSNPDKVKRGKDVPRVHLPRMKLQLATKTREADAILKQIMIGVIWLEAGVNGNMAYKHT